MLGADRVLFTKLDEAVTAGVMLNVSHRLGLRLSFVTTGQEVPHQIEPGNAERLAGWMIDGAGDGVVLAEAQAPAMEARP
ncbi:MAG: hypothetical protein AAF612_12165 [Planctomycetota bacterium]